MVIRRSQVTNGGSENVQDGKALALLSIVFKWCVAILKNSQEKRLRDALDRVILVSGGKNLLFRNLVCLGIVGLTLYLSPLFGQADADALRAKYGAPIEATFDVRPGITLNVVYDDKHQVCKLDLRPKGNASVIPVALIVEVLDEIVPPSARGNLQ